MIMIQSGVKLVACIALCLTAGVIGSYFTMDQIGSWYQTIRKPTWNPPNWIFGPVWMTLYVMMGIAIWLILEKTTERPKSTALILFAIQLVLNSLWSIIFFGQHQMGWAFVEIVLLWVAILATIIAFWRITYSASIFLWPYFAWVSFCRCLEFHVVANESLVIHKYLRLLFSCRLFQRNRYRVVFLRRDVYVATAVDVQSCWRNSLSDFAVL